MITFTSTSPSLGFSRTHQYGGATLLFVLIMLLVVSIIGIAAARSTLMQERMSSNTNIRNVVFEAAESALAEGEARVANTAKIWETIKGKECVKGVCNISTGVEPRWVDTSFWSNNQDGAFPATPVIQKDQEGNSIKIEPKYTIEDLGQTMPTCDPNHIDVTRSPDCPYLSSQRFFRVVGFAKAYNTQVTLQSTYLDPRITRADLEPMDLPPPTKYTCDDGKEYIDGISMCCKDGSTGQTKLHVGQSCPEFCDGQIVGAGQICCTKGSVEYIHTGTTCPEFCGPNQDQYDPETNRCCANSSGVDEVMSGAQSLGCPSYCDGKVHDGSKQCCTDRTTGKESLQDSCPLYCGSDALGWTAGKPGDNDCCETSNSSTPYKYPEQNCCDDINGIKTVINGNCPAYCGSGTSRQPYDRTKQDCCSGQVYDVTNSSDQGQACCNGSTLFDKKTHTCCYWGSIARKGSEECCASTRTVVSIGDCPVFCSGGNTPKKQNEDCCGPNPYVKGPTSECCGGSQVFDPTQNKCCPNVNNRATVMPGPNNGNCPKYCGGQEVQAGMECCDDGKTQKPIGTCDDFCWDSRNTAGVGAPGPCKLPGGGIGG